MSKVGRKPIKFDGVKVEIQGHEVHYKGPKASGVYHLPSELSAQIKDSELYVVPAQNKENMTQKQVSKIYREWGLHHALLANELTGASKEFEKLLEINGLGYKAAVAGNKIILTLGYSHKIEKELPAGISVEIDKSGQKVKVKSFDKGLVGQFCSNIRKLREPEPYKGKGIKLQTEVIFRKSAGKGKK
ncbi:MAG TPA: 50S ribosomal protein L6 [Candidatus Babeliales bacterium]|jgi:large subunit ribosomal protein L6|nr:50S ribosomal protein L6 [Candidatus Babeliales bacterium]